MTGRERLLAAFRGEMPDRVPFSPNLYHWFYFHLAKGTLPEELAHARHPFEALRFLGADILARWDTQPATREVYSGGCYSVEYAGASEFDVPVITAFNKYPPRKNEIRQRFVTPYGVLIRTWTLTEETGADFVSAHWWKDWTEYNAVRFMLESKHYVFDAAEFHRWVERVGEDGIVMVHLTQSPLKTFHWLAGPENASLFLADHPAEMKCLARLHEQKALALLESIVDLAGAEVFISLDNLDSLFYSPSLYREYCHPFFAQAAEIIHGRSKIFLVHACGRNRALLPLAGLSGIDCLEGLTPPPLGDVELAQARQLAGNENFTVNGGMDAARLQIGPGAETRLHDYTRQLFERMGDKRHFILACSCATPVTAPWQNLVYFRDAAREYGQLK